MQKSPNHVKKHWDSCVFLHSGPSNSGGIHGNPYKTYVFWWFGSSPHLSQTLIKHCVSAHLGAFRGIQGNPYKTYTFLMILKWTQPLKNYYKTLCFCTSAKTSCQWILGNPYKTCPKWTYLVSNVEIWSIWQFWKGFYKNLYKSF